MKKNPNKKDKVKGQIDTKLLLWLCVETLVVLIVFSVCMYGVGSIAMGKIVYFGYMIIGLLLLTAAVVFNGGFDSRVPHPEDIVGNLTLEQKREVVAGILRRKRIARVLVFVAFPFLCCLLLDTIYVMLPTGGLF